MNPNTLDVKIDPSSFTRKLKRKIQSDLLVLEALVFSDDIEKKIEQNPSIKFGLIDYPLGFLSKEYIQQREVSKCFRAIMTSIHDYLDELISVLELMDQKNETITISWKIPLSPEGAMDQFFQNKLLEVATRKRFPIPEKLNVVLPYPEDTIYRESLESMFAIRNGLEHHKSLASQNRSLKFKWLVLVDSEGNVLEKLGVTKGGVHLTMKDVALQFDKGNKLSLDKEHLYQMVSSLLTYTLKKLEDSVVRQISENPIDPNTLRAPYSVN